MPEIIAKHTHTNNIHCPFGTGDAYLSGHYGMPQNNRFGGAFLCPLPATTDTECSDIQRWLPHSRYYSHTSRGFLVNTQKLFSHTNTTRFFASYLSQTHNWKTTHKNHFTICNQINIVDWFSIDSLNFQRWYFSLLFLLLLFLAILQTHTQNAQQSNILALPISVSIFVVDCRRRCRYGRHASVNQSKKMSTHKNFAESQRFTQRTHTVPNERLESNSKRNLAIVAPEKLSINIYFVVVVVVVWCC